VDEIGGAEWQVGLVVGGFGLVPIFLRPFVGRWSDQGHRLRLMRGATVVFAGSLALMVLSADVWSLFGLRVVQGIGMAMWPTAAGSLVAEVTPRARRGEGLGFYGMAPAGAQIGFPAIGVWVSDTWGFDAVFIVAAITAASTMLFAAKIHEPPGQGRPRRAARLIPRGALFPMAIFLTFTIAWSAAATFLPLLGKERDLGNTGLFFLVMGVASVVGRPLAGVISDRVGRVPVILPGLLAGALSMWLLTQAQSPTAMLLAGGAGGIGLGAIQTGLLALSIDRVPRGQFGGATAIFQLAWDIGGLVAGVGLGVIATVVDVETVFWVAAGLLVVGLGALLWGRALGWTLPVGPQDSDGGCA
jgi:MFS family permease